MVGNLRALQFEIMYYTDILLGEPNCDIAEEMIRIFRSRVINETMNRNLYVAGIKNQ